MNSWSIIISIYLLTVVAWVIFLFSKKGKARRATSDKFEKVFAYVSIPFAPICWIIGLTILLSEKKKKDRPVPLPKSLQGKLKKDRVSFNGKVMSIAEVNRITGKNYSLEDVYGKKYVAGLKDDDVQQFDDGESELMIDEHVRKDGDFDIVHRFAEARMSGDFVSVRVLFEPNATFVHYEEDTLHGVDAILAFWKDRYESSVTRRVKFDFRIEMCMFYNGPALIEMPERYARMIVMFRIRNGKITQMVLAPQCISPDFPYFGGFREAPYTKDYFKVFLKQKLELRGNRIPCPNCGELSENLDWYIFDKTDRFSYKRYGGTVSICPHCNRTVEIFTIDSSDNGFQSKHPAEEFERENTPNRIPRPKLFCVGFEYAMPLAGSKYVDNLDDTEMIELEMARMMGMKGIEYEPCTAKTCASEFNSLMLSQLSRKNRQLFDTICECYKHAYDDGINEAGNNLAILYLNYAGKEIEGKNLLKECAERGCSNAAANLFVYLWGTGETYEEAISFALSNKTPSISLYWNLAVLYLSGPDIEHNTLDADKEKAKFYLNQIIGGTIPSTGDEGRKIELARNLLRRIDDLDPLASTAREYLKDGIPGIISLAKRGYDQENDLHRVLRHISIPDNMTLRLRLATDENGFGDVSRFQLFEKGSTDAEPICQEEDIIYQMNVEKSVFGAWDIYLFSKARHLLPTYWHGGYNEERLLFDEEDFNLIMSQRGHCRDIIFRGDDLKPKVCFDGDTAFVESCIWSEWGGLFRETVKIVFDGNRVIEFKYEGRKNLYMYDCGIMF